MLYKTMLMLVMVLAAGLSSCDRQPPPILVDWRWVRVGDTTAWFAARGDILGAVIWVDRPGDVSGDATDGHAWGEVRTHIGGIVVKIDCRFTQDTSTATIGGVSYDLTKGAVFLVSTHQMPFQVRQLALNVTGYPGAPPAVQALGRNSPQIAAFVDAAAAPAPTTGPFGPPLPAVKH